MTYQITVENMKCGGCVSNIQAALEKMDGIEHIDINLQDKTVRVEASIEREIISKKLAEIGYPEKV
ncbi:MAG TPA: heavy metal-associated domain-containing protein [Chitinophagales bacterium]|jgi:copper chaperone|nr:heavy-metal-associated domain-containing protein [Chitinophagales bacterium]MBP6153570.1 heavy-metal-associated domain-containing protein [Chitinophagales bacterium]HQV76972.1 heavy metal-associated domain-containing protein [Chitinophagales bacterium]HQW77961.1 heavy metal-associated domain-containing protein [Chitinophagales bacterium]HRB19881.1 heavy metal-associated domain-containing protein [Chitinophagales bacterium]